MNRKESSEIVILQLSDFTNIQKKSPNLSDKSQSLHNLFDTLAKEAKDNDDIIESHILWLMSDLSGIFIKNESKNEVFGPSFVFGNGRSAIPDDFTNEDLNFFELIFDSILNENLKCRVADMLWYLQRKRIDYVQYSISHYLSLSLVHDDFYENREFIIRGLILANQIKNDYSETKIIQFAEKILEYFRKSQISDNAYTVYLAEIMRRFNLNLNYYSEIKEKLSIFANRHRKDGAVFLAGKFYDEASYWAIINKEKEESIRLEIEKAKGFLEAAESTKGMLANSHYETALQIIQSKNKTIRRKYFSEQQEIELIKRLEQSGIECLSEMKPFTFEFSIPNQTLEMNKLFLGKTKEECLKNLSLLPAPVRYDSLLESSISTLSESPLTCLFRSKVFDGNGLIIDSPHTENIDNLTGKDPNVINMMHNMYLLSIQTFVIADISIALKNIISEHRITLDEIKTIVTGSNLIPKDRIEVFSKGLLAGFDFDFTTSLHLLVPQFENLIRFHLKNAGVITFTYDNKKEIEDESSINKYVNTPEFEKMFGKDLAFEIRTVLVEKTGCNFRNKLAHGTLSEAEMAGVNSIYFWWFCFKLVHRLFSNNLRKEAGVAGGA